MTRKAELLAHAHGLDRHGTVWANRNGFAWPVYSVANLDPQYAHLLAAAPLLYRSIDLALPMIDTIGMIFEAHDMEEHVGPLHQLEAGLNAAFRAATDGLIKTSK